MGLVGDPPPPSAPALGAPVDAEMRLNFGHAVGERRRLAREAAAEVELAALVEGTVRAGIADWDSTDLPKAVEVGDAPAVGGGTGVEPCRG